MAKDDVSASLYGTGAIPFGLAGGYLGAATPINAYNNVVDRYEQGVSDRTRRIVDILSERNLRKKPARKGMKKVVDMLSDRIPSWWLLGSLKNKLKNSTAKTFTKVDPVLIERKVRDAATRGKILNSMAERFGKFKGIAPKFLKYYAAPLVGGLGAYHGTKALYNHLTREPSLLERIFD